MIKTCSAFIYITALREVSERIFTAVFDGQQKREKSNILLQTWVGGRAYNRCCHADLSRRPGCGAAVPYFLVCVELLWPTIWTSVPLSLKEKGKKWRVVEVVEEGVGLCFAALHMCPEQKREKAKWEPSSVRCYKLLARPVARPREPDLAAPRLRRVKQCTQRSSLHLYAPYIGRLLLQPTGTWLLAS